MSNAAIALGSSLPISRLLLNSLLCKEQKSLQKQPQPKTRPEICERNRQVHWMLLVGRRWALGLNTMGLSIAILDRILDRLKVQGKYLNCVAVAALCLGIKFHEEIDARAEAFETNRETAMLLAIPSPEPINADDLAAKIRANSFYTQKELSRMERTLLTHLEWDLMLPSFDRMLTAMLVIIGAPHLAASKVLRTQFEIVVSSGSLVCSYAPSVLALSLLSLMLEFTPLGSMGPYITQSLRGIFQIKQMDLLLLCREDISDLIHNFWANKHQKQQQRGMMPFRNCWARPLPPPLLEAAPPKVRIGTKRRTKAEETEEVEQQQ